MILDKLAEYAKIRVSRNKERVGAEALAARALGIREQGPSFKKALQNNGMSLIAEVKKASPSKGIIDDRFDYLKIAEDYENAGADAISCLTEPKWFLGSDEIFAKIRQTVSIPMLRKDFTVDDYQIYEAKTLGANAVLLIVAILEDSKLRDYIQAAHGLGMDALVEAHDRNEVDRALGAGADIIGINNRNLKDFTMNLDNALSLRKSVPDGITFVAESGIRDREDVIKMEEAGVDAVLVGETLMRAPDRNLAVNRLKGKV